MIKVSEILEKLDQLSRGEIGQRDFFDWLADASWNMQATSSPEAVELATMAELVLVDFENGFIGEEEVVSRLEALRPADSGVQEGADILVESVTDFDFDDLDESNVARITAPPYLDRLPLSIVFSSDGGSLIMNIRASDIAAQYVSNSETTIRTKTEDLKATVFPLQERKSGSWSNESRLVYS